MGEMRHEPPSVRLNLSFCRANGLHGSCSPSQPCRADRREVSRDRSANGKRLKTVGADGAREGLGVVGEGASSGRPRISEKVLVSSPNLACFALGA